MTYKPLAVKTYLAYIKCAGWSLKKGSVDWKLFDENGRLLCSIIIAHGKKTREEVIAHSVKKTERLFKLNGLIWPPKKK